ncbi:sensor histidine kinase, partial [Bacillus vallismortis]|nr:sensor histidine kinase [Bacillus vallismortis]
NKNINIVFKKEHLLKEAQIDLQLLHRALLNILTNAVDYTPEGGTVSVYAKCVSESFYFFVRDTGSGFSEIALKKST